MKFKDLFDNSLFHLPKSSSNDVDFKGQLQSLCEEYISLLEKVNDYDQLKGISKGMTKNGMITRQEKFIRGILKSIDLSYDGRPNEAYENLKSTIENRIKNNRKMIRLDKYQKNESFYRMRVKDGNFLYARKEMFHIPFEKRRNVSTQRFSIPGFPSLYIGKTIYVCWEELGRPDLNKFQVSNLINQKEIKYLDLTPLFIDGDVYNSKAFGYIMSWPLILACSIKVQNPKDIYKPEYIIPQLLLQWVRDTQSVDGIRYNSTHINHTAIDPKGQYSNLVMPVKTNQATGLCSSLKKYFLISEPISWQILQVIQGGKRSYIHSKDDFNSVDEKLPHFKIAKNSNRAYSESILGSMEYYLESEKNTTTYLLDDDKNE